MALNLQGIQAFQKALAAGVASGTKSGRSSLPKTTRSSSDDRQYYSPAEPLSDPKARSFDQLLSSWVNDDDSEEQKKKKTKKKNKIPRSYTSFDQLLSDAYFNEESRSEGAKKKNKTPQSDMANTGAYAMMMGSGPDAGDWSDAPPQARKKKKSTQPSAGAAGVKAGGEKAARPTKNLDDSIADLREATPEQPAQPVKKRKPIPYNLSNSRDLTAHTGSALAEDQSEQTKAALIYQLLKEGGSGPTLKDNALIALGLLGSGNVATSPLSLLATRGMQGRMDEDSILRHEYINPALVEKIKDSSYSEKSSKAKDPTDRSYHEQMGVGDAKLSDWLFYENKKEGPLEPALRSMLGLGSSGDEEVDELYQRPKDPRLAYLEALEGGNSGDKGESKKSTKSGSGVEGFMEFDRLAPAEKQLIDAYFGEGTAEKGLTKDQVDALYKAATTAVTEKTETTQNQAFRLTPEDMKKMDAAQRLVLKYNEAGVLATEHDKKNQDMLEGKALDDYDADVYEMFGAEGGSDIVAPQTVNFLKQLGYKAAPGEDLDDFLSGKMLVGARQLARWNNVDMDAFNATTGEDRLQYIEDHPLARIKEIVGGMPEVVQSVRDAQSSISDRFGTNFALFMNDPERSVEGSEYTLREAGVGKGEPRQMKDGTPGWGWGTPEDRKDPELKDIDGYFQNMFEKLARKGDDEEKTSVWNDLNDSASDPKFVRAFLKYADERTQNRNLYGLSGVAGTKSKYKSPAEFREMFNLAPVSIRDEDYEDSSKSSKASKAARRTKLNPEF